MKQERLDYFRSRARAGKGRKLITEFIEHIDSQDKRFAKLENYQSYLDVCATLERVRAEIKTIEGEVKVRDGEDEVHIQADGYRHIRAVLASQSEVQTCDHPSLSQIERDLAASKTQVERWKAAFDEVCVSESQASAKLGGLESKVWGLNESGRLLLERAEKAEREWNAASARAEAAEEKLKLAEARNERLAALLERSRARYIEAEADGVAAHAKVAALEVALQNEERRCTELLKDEEHLKADREALRCDIATRDDQVEVLASTLQKIKAEIEGPGREIYNGDSLIVDAIEAILSERLPAPKFKGELCLAEDKIREQEADIASLTMRVEMADGDYEKALQILSKILGVTTNTCIMEDELRRYILEFSKEVPTSPERDRILRWLRVAYQWNANARSFADAIERREYDQLYSPPPGEEDGRPAMTGEEYDRNLENIG